MTGADLLTRMKVLDNELQVTSGGDDESRCLTALDMAQDYFESVAASMPHIGTTSDTIATVADTETTAWPATLKRVDSLWYIDPTTNKPAWELKPLDKVGAHMPSLSAPWNLTLNPSTGAPSRYSYDSASFYWLPIPDGAYTIRVYGLYSRTNLTTRAITFGWPDEVSLPLAAFACRLLEMGVDDPSDELQGLAEEAFVPVLRSLRKRVRQGPMGRAYTRTHTT